ncbi:class II SORL domain-containing protein [Clostridium sp. D2Q-11]|uniref:Class II SORL domain-containing protein n=1 Tax=Anaeromonas frigoriresistens TaxID=2683708 RepID=A0A942Z7V5_9FIRM|nr:class II SORL domain-containing protein [Anaeromonas frigoriresistens]MBS4537653.1 class II SORL domain-containing protein [Anaeromonas frigoriresistens]
MKSLGNLLQSGDWKGEKHVPVIHIEDTIKAGELIELKVSIGDEIAHPNTLEHHIKWFKIFFKPEDGKFPIEIYTATFDAHGESDIFDEPMVKTYFKTNKPGTIHVMSYCNIHGLWENSKDITVE